VNTVGQIYVLAQGDDGNDAVVVFGADGKILQRLDLGADGALEFIGTDMSDNFYIYANTADSIDKIKKFSSEGALLSSIEVINTLAGMTRWAVISPAGDVYTFDADPDTAPGSLITVTKYTM